MTAQSITVLGRKITYEIREVDISTVEYYLENPRVNYIISKYPKERNTQDFIEKALFNNEYTKELIRDLEANKGLIDEVYVLNNKVVEGNTRLCAYRWLSKKHHSELRWKTIKCRVLQEDVSDEELFYILSTFHIKGKKEWDAYEKAAYIYKMIRVLNKSPEEIGKQIRKHRKSVEAMLKAYETMSQNYLKETPSDDQINASRDELKKYSYFEAFYLQKDLVKRAETPGFVDEFVEWVRDNRLKKAVDVRQLPEILKSNKAKKAFLESEPENAFDEAMQVIYVDRPGKVDLFYKKLRDFRELLENAEVRKIKSEIAQNTNKKYELRECLKVLTRFCKDAGLEVK
ncbi:MAG: hypothetical protein H7843_07545 [Nitrospirota bacterium]